MSRESWIQAGCPRNTAEHDRDDEDLCEAVETVFPLEAECMVMVWSGVYIPLSYKYDLGVMLADIIEIMRGVRDGLSMGALPPLPETPWQRVPARPWRRNCQSLTDAPQEVASSQKEPVPIPRFRPFPKCHGCEYRTGPGSAATRA
jgi:hypothetical protein